MAAEKMVKVIAQTSFASPGWACEKGDVIEVPLADARRMIARRLARELPEAPLPAASKAEAEAAQVREVMTVNHGTRDHPRWAHEGNSCEYQAATRK